MLSPPLEPGRSSFGSLHGRVAPWALLVLVNAIAFYLYAAPLGRQLGQGWVLGRFERAQPGAPFVHEALPELERLRQHSRLYRRRG